MHDEPRTFTPAAGRDWLLPMYDVAMRWLGAESALRQLVDQAVLQPGCRVLDIGCGTGNLAILIKRDHPQAEVAGLDPDPKALARARRKAQRAALSVSFDQGFSDELPYPDDSFDRVFSSFMFHHLELDEKKRTLAEVGRVLRPAGSLHLLDFGGSEVRSDGLLARLLHHNHELQENFEAGIPALLQQMGFSDVHETASRATIVGRVAYYCATSTEPVVDAV